ncbi:hypothetical protein GCM10007860_14690 [Chitiniphilus shinanonensis]|uniref:Solute-binding protein family 3/N-terminal domain-containing protein n=1 Tax=Chitiniphilus shinanonensis TaxID=553088 RepID=A0ABQ6BSH8_9NEIS|nr:hypothetical protein [Chitiniphilus shinanonensis]GLS04322.1 hypothetical protein GCM10007860_14690 [Chitiniphilus shinanonensis]
MKPTPLNPLRRRFCLGLLAGLALAWLPGARAEQSITILTQQDVYNDYIRFIGKRDPLTLTHFSGPGSRRDVVELVLTQQALHLGGLRQPIKLVKVDHSSDSYSRFLREILSGTATLGGNTAWLVDLQEIKDKIYISPPLIRQGEFEAGLYTAPGNQKALAADSLAKVQKLTAVVADSWRPDVATLQGLGMANVLMTQSWDSMVGMVAKQRADVLLAPFQATPDMSLQVGSQRFLPIPKVKVGLQGSRHLFVSRLAPNGAQAAEALEKGLAILRGRGLIERAYIESGFFNTRTETWQRLN